MRRSLPSELVTTHCVDPRPIALGDGDEAVLLLHGLTGTPYEVRPVAQALHGRGFCVRVPLLAGHTDIGALERSSWPDWYASASEALDALQAGRARRVVVLGFSMGALLALRLCALRPGETTGAISLSVPLRTARWRRNAIGTLARLRSHSWLREMVGVYPKRNGPDVRIAREADDSPSLDGFPYPALAEMVALQDEVDELLPHIKAPLLLLHGRLDHATPVANSYLVAQRVASARVEVRVMPRSFHLLGVDLDSDRVCDEVVEFVMSLLGDPHAKSRSPNR